MARLPRPRFRALHHRFGKKTSVSAVVPRGDSNASVDARGRSQFPKSVRLLRHADFERVYKQGRRIFSASMTVFYLPRPAAIAVKTGAGAPSGLRIGFTVGRALGGAVQRNRMKRRLREAVRLARPSAALYVDIVINPKKSLLTTDFPAVRNEIARAFAAIEQKISRKQHGPENEGA